MAATEPVINYIELAAGTMEETKSFYAAVFGWQWVDYGPTYAAFEGAIVTVGLSTESYPAPAHEQQAQSAVGPLVLFESTDLAAVIAGVQTAGGEIVSGPYPYPGGERFHFQDPAGNILGVYQSTIEG